MLEWLLFAGAVELCSVPLVQDRQPWCTAVLRCIPKVGFWCNTGSLGADFVISDFLPAPHDEPQPGTGNIHLLQIVGNGFGHTSCVLPKQIFRC